MSINIVLSNKLKTLANTFILDYNKNSEIFKKNIIVSQTEGIKKWLSLNVAKKNKIFTFFEFVNPDGFINKYIFPELKNTYIDKLFSKNNMKWIIFEILKSALFKNDPDFDSLYEYCKNDNIKLFRLASLIADFFDQYFIYREDMIKSWNNDQLWNKIKNEDFKNIEKWQKKLFLALKENINSINNNDYQNKYFDRIELKDNFIKEIRTNKKIRENIREKFNAIYFFGISIITKYHYDIISEISKYIDCNFYLLNPSKEYWYDIETEKKLIKNSEADISENDFLANYGKSGQEFYNILFKNEDAINNINDKFVDNFEDSLLGLVQKSIFNISNNNNTENYNDFLSDDSVKISSCFTPYREVEVLFDYISDVIAKNNDKIDPGDIVVMMPSVEKYAPYIEAVFGNTKLPYSIADNSYKNIENPINIVMQIINMMTGIFEAEDIMSLVENRFVQNKYKFENIEKIREIIKESTIKWGLNKKNIDKYGDFELNKFNSWSFGLKRIILGYAMQTDSIITFKNEDILPIDTVEGNEALDGLRLFNLVDNLEKLYKSINREKSLDEWREFLNQIFKTFIKLSFNEEKYKDEFNSIIKDYKGSIKIEFNIFKDDFTHIYNNNKNKNGFYTGKITFCSLMPMRNIPNKIIAILGLNENEFPSQKKDNTLDLMQANKFFGDRDNKLSQKYLFLEAIISAEKYLYLSYIGKNTKNMKTMNPSQTIDDLISYIAEITNKSYDYTKGNLIKEYPMYGYSKDYINGKIATYIEENDISGELNSNKKTYNKVDEKNLILDHKSFISFFKNMPKWYCNKILEIYFNDDNILIDGNEVFEINNGLDKWKIKNDLIKIETSNEIKEYISYHQKFKGDLPLGNIAEIDIEKLNKKIEEQKNMYSKYIKNKKENKISVLDNFKINNTELSIDTTFTLIGNELVDYSVSSNSSKKIIEIFIKQLILNSEGYNIKSTLFHTKKYTINSVQQEKAKELIESFLKIIDKYKNRAYPFTIDIAYEYKKKKENLYKEVRKLINGGYKAEKDIYAYYCLGENYKIDDSCIDFFEEINNSLLNEIDNIMEITNE